MRKSAYDLSISKEVLLELITDEWSRIYRLKDAGKLPKSLVDQWGDQFFEMKQAAQQARSLNTLKPLQSEFTRMREMIDCFINR